MSLHGRGLRGDGRSAYWGERRADGRPREGDLGMQRTALEDPRTQDLVIIARFGEHIVDMGDSSGVGMWLEEAGVSLRPSAFVLLRALELRGSATLSQLAEHVGLQASTVSLQLRPLFAGRLISRRADPEDRRSAHLSLTAAGRDLCACTQAAAANEWRKTLADWELKDRQRLGELLTRMLADSDAVIAEHRREHTELQALSPLLVRRSGKRDSEEYLFEVVRYCQRTTDISFAPSAARFMLKRVGSQLPQSAYVLLRRLETRVFTTVSQLADELGVDQSTVSQQLRPLLAKRLVQRNVNAEDRRIAQLAITAAGKRLCLKVRMAAAESLADILKNWTSKERRELARLLARAKINSERIRGDRSNGET